MSAWYPACRWRAGQYQSTLHIAGTSQSAKGFRRSPAHCQHKPRWRQLSCRDGRGTCARRWSGRRRFWDGVPSVPFAAALRLGAAVDNWIPPTLSRIDLAMLQYTGGTTGVSKGAELTHGNVIACVLQIRAALGSVIEQDKETILTVLPFYHIFALAVNLLTFMTFGARNLLLDNPVIPPR